jgi:hypothetical protein
MSHTYIRREDYVIISKDLQFQFRVSHHAIRVAFDALIQDLEPCAFQRTDEISIWGTISDEAIQRERICCNNLLSSNWLSTRSGGVWRGHVRCITVRSASTVVRGVGG